MSTRQQGVLTLLPLFFHVNHPLLPGYVSGSTPAGMSNYEPDANVLTEAQRLTRSFSYKPRHGSNPPRPILGLFLMGSLGTLAQADQSDMDVWVCHGPDLSDDELAELRKNASSWKSGPLPKAPKPIFPHRPGTVRPRRADNQLSSTTAAPPNTICCWTSSTARRSG